VRSLPLAFVALAILAGCAAPQSGGAPAPSASSPPPARVEVTSSTRAELEAVLTERLRALEAKDLKAFQATVDLTRLAFRRCQQEAFDIAARQGSAASATKVAKVEPYGDGYVRAYVEDGSSGIDRRYFRRDGDHWILTEPKVDELGGERSRVVEDVRVDYWGIDEDVVGFVGHEAAATREFLTPYANSTIRDPYSVKLIPTRETAGIVGCQFVAFANRRDEHAPFIGMWRLWLAPKLDRVSDYQQAVLRHEGLHYLQDQFSHNITARLDWWLIEGWPDYVARSRGRTSIVGAVCASTVPTLKRIIDGVPTEPDTPPELTSQYYSLANSMIEYVYATYGAQSYWDLVALYKDNPDYRLNYPKIFKAEPEVFYQGWLAFAKKKYC
jgi:hypothetical protein